VIAIPVVLDSVTTKAPLSAMESASA
jgi:hypothetical protein